MDSILRGRLVSVTYFNLSKAAWDRSSGVHALDFGLDLRVDSGEWSVTWMGIEGGKDLPLNVGLGSIARLLSPDAPVDVVPASSIMPWADLVGVRIDLERVNPCVVRIHSPAASPVVIAAAGWDDDTGMALLPGDEVLVALDSRIASDILSTGGCVTPL